MKVASSNYQDDEALYVLYYFYLAVRANVVITHLGSHESF